MNKDSIIGWGGGLPSERVGEEMAGGEGRSAPVHGAGGKERHGHGDGGRRLLDGSEEVT